MGMYTVGWTGVEAGDQEVKKSLSYILSALPAWEKERKERREGRNEERKKERRKRKESKTKSKPSLIGDVPTRMSAIAYKVILTTWKIAQRRHISQNQEEGE